MMPADALAQVLSPAAMAPACAASIHARFLQPEDLPALVRLEEDKWGQEQAASAEALSRRMEAFPNLSVGAFCAETGAILASLFMKPVAPDFWRYAADWAGCVNSPIPIRTSSLFGISLSSRAPAAVDAVLGFFWPHALTGGWRHIYVGSPVPGWQAWRLKHPGRGIADYVRDAVARTGARAVPRDPQLRYYHARGFKEVVCVKQSYFPHARSQDHGVIVRGTVPLSALKPLWQALPPTRTAGIARCLSPLML